MSRLKKRMGKDSCRGSFITMKYELTDNSLMLDNWLTDDYLMFRERKFTKSFRVYKRPKRIKIKRDSE